MGVAPVVHAPGARRVSASAARQARAVALLAQLALVAAPVLRPQPGAVRGLEALSPPRPLRRAAAARRHVQRARHARLHVPDHWAVLERHQIHGRQPRARRIRGAFAVDVHHAHVCAVRRALRARRREQHLHGVSAAVWPGRALRLRGSRGGERHPRPEAHAQRVVAGERPGRVGRPAGGALADLQAERDVEEARGHRSLNGARIGREGVEAHAALPRRRARHAAAQRAVQSSRVAAAAGTAAQQSRQQRRGEQAARHVVTSAAARGSASAVLVSRATDDARRGAKLKR